MKRIGEKLWAGIFIGSCYLVVAIAFIMLIGMEW